MLVFGASHQHFGRESAEILPSVCSQSAAGTEGTEQQTVPAFSMQIRKNLKRMIQ
jgi:hypothetical protein